MLNERLMDLIYDELIWKRREVVIYLY